MIPKPLHTYSPGNGFEVYFNGRKVIRTEIKTGTPTSVSIELGCTGGVFCAKMNYDELRFWNTTKSPQFMWWLSRM